MFTDDLEDYLLIAETIKSAQINDNTAIAITPKNIDTVIIAKAADALLNISGISVSFVLGEIIMIYILVEDLLAILMFKLS